MTAVTGKPDESTSDEERRVNQRNLRSCTAPLLSLIMLFLLWTWLRCRVHMLTLPTGTIKTSRLFIHAKSEAARAPKRDIVNICYGSRDHQ